MRRTFIVSLAFLACGVVIAFTAWRVAWPEWQHYRAVRAMLHAVERDDFDALDGIAGARTRRNGGDAAIEAYRRLLRSGFSKRQFEAARRLAELGPKAAPAVPDLIALLDDGDNIVRHDCSYALGMIGPAAVPGLIESLDHPSAEARGLACESLERIGPAAAAAIPRLVELLAGGKETEAYPRAWAALALGKIDSAGEQALPALIAALEDKDSSVWFRTIQAIDAIGRNAADAMPALASSMHQQYWDDNRCLLLGVLVRVMDREDAALAELLTALNADDEPERLWALEALASGFDSSLEWDLDEIRQRVVSLLHGDNEIIRWGAVRLLGRLGKVAVSTMPELAEALQDPAVTVRITTAQAMIQLDPQSEPAFDALAEALKHKEIEIRYSSLHVLFRFGAAAVPAVPALIECLGVEGADYSSFRQMAAQTLGKVGTEARAAVPALTKTLTDPDFGVRQQTEFALKKIDPERADELGVK